MALNPSHFQNLDQNSKQVFPLLTSIAFKHLFARKRQSLVSLSGIILGVSFFLAISSLMQGSEEDFIRRLVDNSPHITVSDEFRTPRVQPAQKLYGSGALDLRSVKPLTENRGIRGYEKILPMIRSFSGLKASPVLGGQVLLSFAGKDIGLNLSGVIPGEINDVSTIQNYMVAGYINDLAANPDGLIIGTELARKISLKMGDNISVSSPGGQVRILKIVGLFRTGRSNYDNNQGFVTLKKAQALLGRPNRINSVIMKLADPYQALDISLQIEKKTGYKAVSWQEASEDILNTLKVRNTIMYTVVSAVLVVAAFGIYNVISTVVMEKHRDIAIMKAMGFRSGDVLRVFLIQGFLLGILGCVVGLPLGSGFMLLLMQIRLKPPGSTDWVHLPLAWDWRQFLLAASFAMFAAVIAAYLPARKGARVQPVDILRGSM